MILIDLDFVILIDFEPPPLYPSNVNGTTPSPPSTAGSS